MNYCENCGAKLEENAKFCEECGAKVDDFDSTKIAKSELRTTQKKERAPLTKKQRIIGASILGIILLLFSGYQLGATVYSQENQTNHITEALASKDTDRIAEVIKTDDSNFEVNSDNLEGFVSYLDQNPDYLNELMNELNNYGSYDSFYIEQDGKKLGLYEEYKLVMVPVYGTVYTNAEGVSISLDEEELLVSDSESFSSEIGPFAPGILTFTAEGQINDLPLTVTEEVTWLSASHYNEVDLTLTGNYFYIQSDLEDATVYIDDKSIGQLEEGYGEFGPVQIENGMKLHIAQTFREEEVTSEKVELTEDDTYYEFYDLVLGTSSDVMRLLDNTYYTAYQLTRNYENYIDDYNNFYHPDGPAYEDQRLSFLSFGETASSNDDINDVKFDVSVNEIKRTAWNAFDVVYEVTYTTNYSYQSGRENGMRHYSKEATVVFEPTDHPNRDFDSFIYEIRNEELVYEEGHEGSTESTNVGNKSNEEKASAVVTNFIQNLPQAVNNNEFSAIAGYINSSSDFYKSQSSFVTDTYDQGITEELDHFEIHEVSLDGETAKVKATEQFTIKNGDSKSQSKYVAVYELKKIDGNYLITNLVIE